MPPLTPQQQAARLNPQPFNVKLPQIGQRFRVTGDIGNVFRRTDSGLESLDLTRAANLSDIERQQLGGYGGQVAEAQKRLSGQGLNLENLQEFNLGDVRSALPNLATIQGNLQGFVGQQGPTMSNLTQTLNAAPPPASELASVARSQQQLNQAQQPGAPRSRDQIQQQLDTIKSGLGQLSAKGYGNVDVSQIPKGIDISQLPQYQAPQQQGQQPPQPQQGQQPPQPQQGQQPPQPGQSDAEKVVQSFLTPGTKEGAVTDKASQIEGQLNALESREEQLLADIRKQPISAGFLSGQSAAVQRQFAIDRNALQREKQTLISQLANLQAQRASALDVSKFQLQREDEKAKVVREQEKAKIDQANDAVKIAREQAKFEEDKRQYGLDYALKKREVGIKEQEAGAKAGFAGDKQSATLDLLNLTNAIISSPYLDQITGLKRPSAAFGGILGGAIGSANQEVLNQFNQLKANLSLENRQKLKGSGAISDFESRTLEKSASAMGTNLSNEAMKRQLSVVKGVLATASGLSATVKITDPKTGQTQTLQADRAGINQAISDGLNVEYK